MIYGLTKEEYKELLKECGMCTKKWTISKLKDFDNILNVKNESVVYITANNKPFFRPPVLSLVQIIVPMITDKALIPKFIGVIKLSCKFVAFITSAKIMIDKNVIISAIKIALKN